MVNKIENIENIGKNKNKKFIDRFSDEYPKKIIK